ncbi:phosphoenolpyruvate carboxylase kinase 1-like [Silene latifolia]|uniref:phosphoenolpyruvate carboxylase kinase 1-like n=1 Tax=Silene latifolia TaxID=37657 RepID=UPI003D76A76C
MLPLLQDYDLLDEIARGKFGVVSRCTSRATGEIYAVKSINKSTVINDPTDFLSLTNEPKALSLLSTSPYITRLHRAYDTPTHLHLVLDYSPHPTLYDIVSQSHVPEHEAREITASLLHAIVQCHRTGVVHRDIKPENILLDRGEGSNPNRVKLCDFGSAGFLVGDDVAMTEVVGTPYYVAPEILEGRGYGEKVDVWSAGVVLYVMIAGFPPFYGESTEEVFQKVLRGNLRFPTRVFGGVSSAVKDLLRKMICKDVDRRLSAEDALRHQWFACGGGGQSTRGA